MPAARAINHTTIPRANTLRSPHPGSRPTSAAPSLSFFRLCTALAYTLLALVALAYLLLCIAFPRPVLAGLVDFTFAPYTATVCALSYTTMVTLFLVAPLATRAAYWYARVYFCVRRPKPPSRIPDDFAAALAQHIRDELAASEPHFVSWLVSPLRRANILAFRIYRAASSSLARCRTVGYRLQVLHALLDFSGLFRIAVLLFVFSYVLGAGDDDPSAASSRPPTFDGTRLGFISWLMTFSGWVAWKLTPSSVILDGTLTRPIEPVPVNPAAPTAAETTLHNTWLREVAAFDTENTKLYGAILQAVPDYLRTSIYNDHRNDGIGAVRFLRTSFDSNDANDHASQMARLQGRYIDSKNDIDEADLRLQYDSMMVAKAGIQRTGNVPPNDAAIIAMFDNSLPIAYSQIRQLVRRAGHATFLAHFNDYMGQVRAELSARKPVFNAFSTFVPRPPGTSDDERSRSTRGKSSNLCLRCAKPGHLRPNCPKPKTTCKHCGADHASKLCPKGPGGSRRDSLSDNARRLLDRDVKSVNSSSSDSDGDPPLKTDKPSDASASVAASATAAAALPVVVADQPQPFDSSSAHAYLNAMKTMGFGQ